MLLKKQKSKIIVSKSKIEQNLIQVFQSLVL